MAYENCMSITLNAATGADVRQRRFVTVGTSGIGEAADGADAVGERFRAVLVRSKRRRSPRVVLERARGLVEPSEIDKARARRASET